MGIWHAGNIISNVISGLLAAAILTNMDNIAGLHSWQWFFLIEGKTFTWFVPVQQLICATGIVSIAVGVLGFKFIPNWPNDTGSYFLSEEEGEMAQYRAELSAGGRSEDDAGGYRGGVAQACRDPFTWMFAGLHFSLIIAQSFKDFLPSVCTWHLDVFWWVHGADGVLDCCDIWLF